MDMWMHGWGGYGGVWMVASLLFWVLVIVAVVVLVVWLVRRTGAPGAPRTGDDPTTVLKQRYAHGEITREQYLQMKQDIEQKTRTPG